MEGLGEIVALRYGGSLKAEHGTGTLPPPPLPHTLTHTLTHPLTGRNMAPYVEMEWGREAYEIMRDVKALFDPRMILSPGVLLNSDPLVHLKNLKPLPRADPVVDTCIECGFCESACPSRELTLTPRQRITIWREISRLRESPKEEGTT